MTTEDLTRKELIEYAIGLWHDSDSDKSLIEYLGWTEEEYGAYVERNVLPTKRKGVL